MANLNKYVRLRGTAVYPHMPILRPHVSRYTTNVPSLSEESASAWATRIRPILGFLGAKFPEMRDFLPWTPVNRRAKFDAAIFILSGETRNRIHTYAHTQTHKQTVNDISTPCLSAFVDNKHNNLNLNKHANVSHTVVHVIVHICRT